jgi:phosphoribosylanthranilate isomerase
MQPSRIAVALAAVLSLSVVACGGPEAAVTATEVALDVTPCFDLIGTLEAQTQSVQFTSPKDQAGLLVKLDEATQKLGLGKNADAVLKLQNFHDRVAQLVAAGKIAPGTAADGTEVTPKMLLDGAQTAIACIQPPTT